MALELMCSVPLLRVPARAIRRRIALRKVVREVRDLYLQMRWEDAYFCATAEMHAAINESRSIPVITDDGRHYMWVVASGVMYSITCRTHRSMIVWAHHVATYEMLRTFSEFDTLGTWNPVRLSAFAPV